MTPARLILLLLLILVAVVVVLVVLRRGSAQRDAQRVEAAGLRAEAESLAPGVAGQSAFADQAAQRAEQARVEAEDKAREAARLEAEAEERRAAAEASKRDYEAAMRRADDIDPDVKESEYPAVSEGEPTPAASGSTDAAPAPAAAGAAAAADARGDDLPMTRAERREAREAEGASDRGSATAAPSVAAAGAAGGAAVGASAWGTRGDEGNPESERIASAADFRDDVPADAADQTDSADTMTDPAHDATGEEAGEVYAAGDRGTGSDMSDGARTDTPEHTSHGDGLGAGEAGAAAAAGAGAGGAYAATRALHDLSREDTTDDTADGTPNAAPDDTSDATDGTSEGTPDATADSADRSVRAAEPADDLSRDVESPRGEWGGPPQDEPAEMTFVEPEAYATTEPVMASEQSAPVQPEAVDGDHEDTTDDGTRRADAEPGAAVTEADDTDRRAADVAEESTQERYDPTPTRDWAADEGALLEETHDRGDRLEAERADLAHESDHATDAPVSGDATDTTSDETDTTSDETDTTSEETGTTASEDASASDETNVTASDEVVAPAPDDETGATAAQESGSTPAQGRRISDFDELRDGGFGVGSAAPLDDGAQPLDHPVAAYRDTMTYRVPGDPGYDAAEPHVWFYDEGAAERSGFRRSQG